MGAIGSPDTIDILEQYLKDPVKEVAETCEIALARIKWLRDPKSTKEQLSNNPYASVDPAPPSVGEDVNKLKQILLNDDESLFERYRAMFALRNLKTKDAIVALGEALNYGSALFRHEIAFVLGQLQDEESVSFLKKSLEDHSENEMVRHECAEALGAIATEDCFSILARFLTDGKRVVKESCEIALDMCEYENSPEFQYANTLQVVT